MDGLCFQHWMVVEGDQMVAEKKENLVVKVMTLMTVAVVGKLLRGLVVAALRLRFAGLVDRQDETFC